MSESAIKIQKLFRGKSRRRLNENNAAVKIQKRMRGHFTRKRINALGDFSKNPRNGAITYANAVNSISVPPSGSKSAFLFSKLTNKAKGWDKHLTSFSKPKTNIDDAIIRLKYLMLEQATNNEVKDPEHYVDKPDYADETGIQIFKLDGQPINISELTHYGNMRTKFGKFINKTITSHYDVKIYIFEFENITIIISVDEDAELWGDRIRNISQLLR